MAEQTWTISAIPAGALVGNPRSIFEVGADEISNERVIADLAGANYAIYPTNLQYFTGGFGTTLSLDLSSTPAGNSQVSDEMSATFERQGVITITIGGHELTLTIGADTNRDTGEPYSWTLTSAARTRGNAWLAQLSAGDSGTLTLSDGVTSTDHVISTAGTPEWDFETTDPTVTVRTARHIIASAGTPEWDFETTEPTVTHRTTQHVIATAGTPEWDFETTEPSVTHRTTRHTIASAGAPEWDFETTEPSVTLTAAAPVTTTEHAYRLAQTLEATDLPSSTAEAVPTGWSATEPARTATESVYRLSSDVTRLRGVFVSRTAWAWSPAFASQPYRRSINSLSRYIRKFVTNVRHKDSGAQASVVVAIQADPPEGIGYRELTIYQTVTLAANAPAAPAAPEWDGATLSAIGSWSVTFPTYDPNTHRVACAIVLVSTENTAEVIGTVAFCESPGDLNAVFVRSETQPARLTDSATRLPNNTYDTQGNVPAGDGHIYVAIGNRPPNGTTWTWSAWDQLEGTDGQDGRDGAPGASGIAQRFAVNLGTALPDNNSEIRLRDGATNIDSLTDANAADVDTIQVGISTGTAEATVRRRRGYGGLGGADVVTVREAADQGGNSKFVDYEVTAVSPSPLTGTTRTATLTVSHIEHRLPSAIEGTAVFGISRSLDGIDGIPGTRGLVGYAKSLTRSTRAANAGAVNSATEWFLSGSTANWTGNRTLTAGVSAAEEAELRRVGIGALLTAYDDSDNWADYTLRSAATFTGTGATRAAALSLAHREGFGSPPTTGAVELHYTPAGQDGEDGVSTALVTIWKRSATQPTDTPADGATYTYATGALTGTLNSWVAGTPPAGTNRLWARVASVRGRTATATIDATDWSGVVHDEGADGISTANVTIYQRADAQPTAPARSVRHTFATGANVWTGAGAQNGWQLNIAGTSTQTGTKLWIAHAAAAGDGATDDIASSEWSVGQLAEKGDKGDPGTAGGLNTIYRRATTQPGTPAAATADVPQGWADDPPTGTAQLWASNGSEDPDTNIWTWQTPRKAFERTDAPTVAIAVTGNDDIRVTVVDPSDTTGIIGHRIDLERLESGDWLLVESITHVGLTTSVGRGKSFSNRGAGQYRAEVQTVVSPGFIESAYVFSSTVTTVDGPDNPPNAPAAPTLSFVAGVPSVDVAYVLPSDNGNTGLALAQIRLYRGGTSSGNRLTTATQGVLQGTTIRFSAVELMRDQRVEITSGTYYADVRWRNSNGDNADGNGPWSSISSALRVTVTDDGGGTATTVAPSRPTIRYDIPNRAVVVGFTTSGNGQVSIQLFKDGTTPGHLVTSGKVHSQQASSFAFQDVAKVGTYYGRFLPPGETEWSTFSAPLDIQNLQYGITNKVLALPPNAVYQFTAVKPESAYFRLDAGSGSLSRDGRFTAGSGGRATVSLVDGGTVLDSNEFGVSSGAVTITAGSQGSRITSGPVGNPTGIDIQWDVEQDSSLSEIQFPNAVPPAFVNGNVEAFLTQIRFRSYSSDFGGPNIGPYGSASVTFRTARDDDSGSRITRFSQAFLDSGTIIFRITNQDGTHSLVWDLSETTPISNGIVNTVWAFPQELRATVWNILGGGVNVRPSISVTLTTETALENAAGSISNKILSIDEQDSRRFLSSGVLGGEPVFRIKRGAGSISIDGLFTAAQVGVDTVTEVGLFVGLKEVDSDVFTVNAITEQGRLANKIQELRAHEFHGYQFEGVAGGTASVVLAQGVGEIIGNAYSASQFVASVTRDQTVRVNMLVGGVEVDSDTFTLKPTVGRIANKISRLPNNRTHQFRVDLNSLVGVSPSDVAWHVESGIGMIDANGVYRLDAPPALDDTARVTMLIDNHVVDFNEFTISGYGPSPSSLDVEITNPVEVIAAGGSHTFDTDVGGTASGSVTYTWQSSYNLTLPEVYGTLTPSADGSSAVYAAPDTVDGQGFGMDVEVIVDRGSLTSSFRTLFWVGPGEFMPEPIVDVFVTQDDVRVVLHNPVAAEALLAQIKGFELVLQWRTTGQTTWNNTPAITLEKGLLAEEGIGRTFANRTAGREYRAAGRTLGRLTQQNSVWVLTEPVEVEQDFPDEVPGPPNRPTASREADDLAVEYADPEEDGGTHLTRFRLEVYKDGEMPSNRIASSGRGTRQGRRHVFPGLIAANGLGSYRVRVACENANSASIGIFNWSPFSDPLVIT